MLVDTKIPLNDLKLVMEAFSYSLKGLKKNPNLNFEPTALCSGYHLLSTGRAKERDLRELMFSRRTRRPSEGKPDSCNAKHHTLASVLST